MENINFRIGTTSYIIPDDIIPNVRYLGGKVDDIELVLFEVDDGPSNLLTPAQQAALASLAQQNGMTYTVHLPLDLNLAEDANLRDVSFIKAKKAIDCTLGLEPWAYVLHLEGRERLAGKQSKAEWLKKAELSLNQLSEWVGDARLLAIENIDHYPIDFIDDVFEGTAFSRCIDIGHLWLEGHDAVAYLEKHIHRARVLHIHGVAERDHKSLKHVELEELKRVMNVIHQSGFNGVMTIEVFNDEDLRGSIEQLNIALAQLGLSWQTQSGESAKPAKYHRDLYESLS